MLYNFYINFLLINSDNICGPNKFCSECNFCYSSCFYYQAFCADSDGKLNYSVDYINAYRKNYFSDSDIKSFCGEEYYFLKDMNLTNSSEVIIFDSKYKKFKIGKYMICNFYIILDRKSNLKPTLIFQTKEKYPTSDLRFRISNIYTINDGADSKICESFSFENLTYFSEAKLGNKISVQVLLDFFNRNVTTPNDNLEIKLIFNKAYTIEDEKEEEEKKKNFSYATAGGITLGGILVIIAIYCCCKCCKKEDR